MNHLPVVKNYKLFLILFSTLFLFNSGFLEDRRACGPVDYFHAKVPDKDQHLDSWLKDSNGPFEHIINLTASWWKNARHFDEVILRYTCGS